MHKSYTSKLPSDNGLKHVSASFMVNGTMVGVDFNPVAVVGNKELQEAIEGDPMYGVNFELFGEPADEPTDSVRPQAAASGTSAPEQGGGIHGTITTDKMAPLNTNSVVGKGSGKGNRPAKANKTTKKN